jgi:hypothetical protein
VNSDLDLIREHVEQAKGRSEGIDPDLTLRLIDALQAAEPELLLLRSLVADIDVFFDSEEGPLFQQGHACRLQGRVAQFWREHYKPNAEARGHRVPGRTWGRGRG